jgi:predicted metal-dependent hydrolase
MESIRLAEIEIELIQKDIKNVHLSVYPPHGKVKVSAPASMSQDVIRAFLISKLPWIRSQQQSINAQEREAPREYVDRESHYLKGERMLLEIHHTTGPHRVVRNHRTLRLYLRSGAGKESRQRLLEQFYRDYLRSEIPLYIAKHEPLIGVNVVEFGIKKMRTRWGTCSYEAGRIWINLELAKKPPECLEYLVVHEMVHLLEPRHNARFKALMDRHYPRWRSVREELNRLPVRHEEWGY